MTTSRTQFHARVWVSLSMLLGFGLFGAASASEAQPISITVSYPDLDLSRIGNAQRLYSRLQRASAIVCGSFDESSLPLQVEWQRCYKQALAKAVVTVNAPLLQTVYAVRAARRPGDPLPVSDTSCRPSSHAASESAAAIAKRWC